MYYKEHELVDGQKLAYIRVNEWKDNVVLFFHGFTGSKEYFPLDTPDACIISFDRPGVGESSLSEYVSV